jgi:hypothetical protein
MPKNQERGMRVLRKGDFVKTPTPRARGKRSRKPEHYGYGHIEDLTRIVGQDWQANVLLGTDEIKAFSLDDVELVRNQRGE